MKTSPISPLRSALSPVPFLLFLLALAACLAGCTRPSCNPVKMNDGGSICLPEGWTIKEPDGGAAPVRQFLHPGLRSQMLVVAARPESEGGFLGMQVMRLGIPDGQGRLDPAARDLLPEFARQTAAAFSGQDLIESPRKVSLGGRDYWRMVVRGPQEGVYSSILCTTANDALYQIWIGKRGPDASGLSDLEDMLLPGWKPGSEPMRQP